MYSANSIFPIMYNIGAQLRAAFWFSRPVQESSIRALEVRLQLSEISVATASKVGSITRTRAPQDERCYSIRPKITVVLVD